jgi:RimJ/RimL family protein N-acetyltransferase
LIAAVIDDQAVAVCGSVRITARAHEAGVETSLPHRGHGYAAQTTAAWAKAVRALGVEPLYSTSWDNAASRAVARKLGLIHFCNDLHLT